MNLKETKKIFDDIIELCYQLEDEKINNAIDSFYQDVKASKTTHDVLEIVNELMFYIDEYQTYDADLEEIVSEIEDLYDKMQDELE